MPRLQFLLLDMGAYPEAELARLKNLVAALFRLENSPSPEKLQEIINILLDLLKLPRHQIAALQRLNLSNWELHIYGEKYAPARPLASCPQIARWVAPAFTFRKVLNIPMVHCTGYFFTICNVTICYNGLVKISVN